MGSVIGRIISCKTRTARVELTQEARAGMLVSVYVKRRGRRYVGKIERIESSSHSGLHGFIYWLDEVNPPLRTMTEIQIADEENEEGILYIGKDGRGISIKVRLNPLFGHTLVAGITGAGKTHFMIALCEELGAYKVPCLVIDAQGEFVNLPRLNPERFVVVEELRMEDLKAHLQQRRIVIYNLLGLTKKAKVTRVAEILTDLMTAKEKDYNQAGSEPRLLELSPMLVVMDEGDIFAPNIKMATKAPREAVGPTIDILERGFKFGLGAIVATQRITRLDLDVRSQCNSAAIFRLKEAGSIQVIRSIDYIPKEEIQNISSFEDGECLLTGIMVRHPRRIKVRDIVSERVKPRDFEGMLGIVTPEPEDHQSRFEENDDGDLVDVVTGKVIHDGLERLIESDQDAFEASEDGVVLRSHLSSKEQKVLRKLRNPDEKGDRLIG